MINSKDKGKRFELTIARVLRENGYEDAHRTAQYCGNTGKAADVVGIPGVHIECKHVEKMHLYDWMQQAEDDSRGTGNVPVVMHRQNGKGILCTMRFFDWMRLYKAAYAQGIPDDVKGYTEDENGE